MVIRSIIERERISKALQEVGGVRSICDGRNSTTLLERRNLTLCTPALRRGVLMCSLYHLDSYKREYIELMRYDGESRGTLRNKHVWSV